MKKHYIIALFICFLIACDYVYDHDLMRPDSHGSSYLTPLGCLVNGPWAINEEDEFYNETQFLDTKEISSKKCPYTKMQKDLVFELHKAGTISYWLKSENDYESDSNQDNDVKVVTKKTPDEDNLKKIYTNGYWKVNFNDSSVLIHFENRDIPEIKYKFISLGNGNVSFQESFVLDSTYSGKKMSLKKVNTVYYETLYPRF